MQTTVGQQFDDIAFDGRAVEDPGVTRIANELLHTLTRSTLILVTAAIVVVASGHATIGMALSLGIVMVAPYRWRWLAMAAAAVVAIGFGVGVLATGWHRPSDTVGAYLVCTTWFSAATAMLLGWRGPGRVGDDLGEIEDRLTRPVVAIIGALIAVAALVVLVLSFREEGLRTVEYAMEYLAVCLVVIALAVVIVVGYHQLLRGVSLDQPSDDLPGQPLVQPGRSAGGIS